ncbi:MAG: sulfotransferase family protein [Acidobacteria bacterium]|nr:sulfotransferase family protein [Acidobacteriota bacterium]TDI23487.1 MAG: sulfotransferase family protein [Acidobacteriota bacterium]
MAGLLHRLFGRGTPGVEQSVVIVSGLPRSGTSMLMGMLAAGGLETVVDGIREADDDNPKGYHELELVKELDKGGDTSWLDDARGKCLKVISFLLQHLPSTHHYKIVFVRRSLQEVLASQRTMLERRGESGGDASDEEMAKMFAAHLTKTERQLAARPNCEVLYVDHRATLNTPREVAAQVSRFLGDRLDVEKMTAVVDQQLYRNRTTH